eukprot:248923_1
MDQQITSYTSQSWTIQITIMDQQIGIIAALTEQESNELLDAPIWTPEKHNNNMEEKDITYSKIAIDEQDYQYIIHTNKKPIKYSYKQANVAKIAKETYNTPHIQYMNMEKINNIAIAQDNYKQPAPSTIAGETYNENDEIININNKDRISECNNRQTINRNDNMSKLTYNSNNKLSDNIISTHTHTNTNDLYSNKPSNIAMEGYCHLENNKSNIYKIAYDTYTQIYNKSQIYNTEHKVNQPQSPTTDYQVNQSEIDIINIVSPISEKQMILNKQQLMKDLADNGYNHSEIVTALQRIPIPKQTVSVVTKWIHENKTHMPPESVLPKNQPLNKSVNITSENNQTNKKQYHLTSDKPLTAPQITDINDSNEMRYHITSDKPLTAPQITVPQIPIDTNDNNNIDSQELQIPTINDDTFPPHSINQSIQPKPLTNANTNLNTLSTIQFNNITDGSKISDQFEPQIPNTTDATIPPHTMNHQSQSQ